MFVSIEGVDGCGKSTQARFLEEHLRSLGREVVSTREPGGTELGERVRQLVLNGPQMAPWAEAALFAASRAEHAAEVIRPALARGADVVSDRFIDSSLAYQGIARGLGLDAVLELNLTVLEGLLPDRTFVIALDAVEAGRRAGGRSRPDRARRRRVPGGGRAGLRAARGPVPRARRADRRVAAARGDRGLVQARVEDLL